MGVLPTARPDVRLALRPIIVESPVAITMPWAVPVDEGGSMSWEECWVQFLQKLSVVKNKVETQEPVSGYYILFSSYLVYTNKGFLV